MRVSKLWHESEVSLSPSTTGSNQRPCSLWHISDFWSGLWGKRRHGQFGKVRLYSKEDVHFSLYFISIDINVTSNIRWYIGPYPFAATVSTIPKCTSATTSTRIAQWWHLHRCQTKHATKMRSHLSWSQIRMHGSVRVGLLGCTVFQRIMPKWIPLSVSQAPHGPRNK